MAEEGNSKIWVIPITVVVTVVLAIIADRAAVAFESGQFEARMRISEEDRKELHRQLDEQRKADEVIGLKLQRVVDRLKMDGN